MNKRYWILLFSVCISSLLLGCSNENGATIPSKKNEIIVGFKQDVTNADKVKIRQSVKGIKISELKQLNSEVWFIPKLDIEHAIKKIQNIDVIQYVEPNTERTID